MKNTKNGEKPNSTHLTRAEKRESIIIKITKEMPYQILSLPTLNWTKLAPLRKHSVTPQITPRILSIAKHIYGYTDEYAGEKNLPFTFIHTQSGNLLRAI